MVSTLESINNNPYPRYIETNPNTNNVMYVPRFIIWNEIKQDSRILQIPKWIQKLFDQYMLDLDNYVKIQTDAFESIKRYINEEFKYQFGIACPSVRGIENLLLKAIITGEKDDFKHHLFRDDSIDSNEFEKIWEEVFYECNKLPNVTKFKNYYKDVIIGRLNWLVKEIAQIIHKISSQYETRGDLY